MKLCTPIVICLDDRNIYDRFSAVSLTSISPKYFRESLAVERFVLQTYRYVNYDDDDYHLMKI